MDVKSSGVGKMLSVVIFSEIKRVIKEEIKIYTDLAAGLTGILTFLAFFVHSVSPCPKCLFSLPLSKAHLPSCV
jgi:hypothetical protein